MAQRFTKPTQSKNNLIPILGIICVLIFGLGLVISLKKPSSKAMAAAPVFVAEYELVQVPVPAEPVPAGTKFSDIKLKNVSLPKHQVPEGALTDTIRLLETVTLSPLPANLPFFENNFSRTAHKSNPVIERIPQGMRAMTIKVDATSSVEGWAGSGTIVDVLLVENDRTTVIAENVRILSAERSVSPVEGSASPDVPSTVTLLVTQEQCLAINTAIPRGKLAFALRSFGDEANWNDRTFTSDQLVNHETQTKPEANIKGYVEIKDDKGSKSFALSDGKWLKTQAKPEGFLVGEN